MKGLLTHMVAGFPAVKMDEKVALALLKGGSRAIELQLPFSDPIADGPIIQAACAKALSGGYNLSYGFKLIERLVKITGLPLYVMSYASPVFTVGVRKFIENIQRAGAEGLIVPDLPPPDFDENLYLTGKKAGLKILPVIVPDLSERRLKAVLSVDPEAVYVAIRKGITGQNTKIESNVYEFLKKIRPRFAKIMAGFGVNSQEQVADLAPYVDYVVVGSHLIKETQKTLESKLDLSEHLASQVAALL